MVTGVVRAKLNALWLAQKTGDIAQTVNDALKSSRPYETFRKAEASIVAVVGRQAAVAATGAVKDVQLPDKAGN